MPFAFEKSEEYFYLWIILRWEQTTPPPGQEGSSPVGTRLENSQQERLAFVLRLIAGVAQREEQFRTLEYLTRRPRAGVSYVSRKSNKLLEPISLGGGWFLEGNMSLPQKKDKVIFHLKALGVSQSFIRCVEDFVEVNSIETFVPTDLDPNLLERFREQMERAWVGER